MRPGILKVNHVNHFICSKDQVMENIEKYLNEADVLLQQRDSIKVYIELGLLVIHCLEVSPFIRLSKTGRIMGLPMAYGQAASVQFLSGV